MRYIIIRLLCLTFCSIGVFSFGDSGESTETPYPNPARSQPYRIDDTLWVEYLDTFKKRLPTDPAVARTESKTLQKNCLADRRSLKSGWPSTFA